MTKLKGTDMDTVFYTQHELTDGEIRRDEARNAAIARNRAKSEPVIHIKDPSRDATDPQKGKIRALLADLARVDHTTWQTASAWIDANLATMNMGLASQTIDRLKIRIAEAGNAPQAPTVRELVTVTNNLNADVEARRAERDRFTDVPDGYYAVTNDDNVLAFYRVSTWTKSGDRKVQVHASDELHLVRGWKSTDAILAKIRLATPPMAGKRFADEIGSCYRCGRTLTDETSRALGIGPKCRTMA